VLSEPASVDTGRRGLDHRDEPTVGGGELFKDMHAEALRASMRVRGVV
jgi:hypothetical protein